MERDDVRCSNQIIFVLVKFCAEHGFHGQWQAVAVMIGDFHSECPRAVGNSLTNPAHTDNAQNLAAQLPAQQARWCPAGPFAFAHQGHAFAYAARHADDHRHRQIGSVIGKHARRVGNNNPAILGSFQINVVCACTEAGDQAKAIARCRNQLRVDTVRHCRHQNIAFLHRRRQLIAGHGRIFGVQRRII